MLVISLLIAAGTLGGFRLGGCLDQRARGSGVARSLWPIADGAGSGATGCAAGPVRAGLARAGGAGTPCCWGCWVTGCGAFRVSGCGGCSWIGG
ncbi:MAG: hypothetical protein MZU84_05350 [Sphingobacterium sp.]|nr:hypothetical protein [Sphingobacterium sp.]